MTGDLTYVAAVGSEVRLGKLPPVVDPHTPALADYLLDAATGLPTSALPVLPPELDRSGLVPANAWGELGNAVYGDCTVAALGHAQQITSAVVSDGKHIAGPTEAQVLAAYWATGVPPTPGADDKGRAMLDVLKYAASVGIGGEKVSGYATIDVSDPKGAIRYAIDLLGFCYIGLELPLSAQSQRVWSHVEGPDAKAGSWGGHAVILVDYDSAGTTCITWGTPLQMTWGFWTAYCDEAYAVLLPSWLDAQGRSPASLDVSQLEADVAAIATPD